MNTNETPTPNAWIQPMIPGQSRDCIHGSLARSCEFCERDKQIFQLERENAQLRQLCMEAGIGDYKANYYLGKLTLFGELDSARQQLADEKALREYSERNQITLQNDNKELRRQLELSRQLERSGNAILNSLRELWKLMPDIENKYDDRLAYHLGELIQSLQARNVQLREALELLLNRRKEIAARIGREKWEGTDGRYLVAEKALSTKPESSLLNELQALREDKERLDWLDLQNWAQVFVFPYGTKLQLNPKGHKDEVFIDTSTVRLAIDAARGKEKQ